PGGTYLVRDIVVLPSYPSAAAPQVSDPPQTCADLGGRLITAGELVMGGAASGSTIITSAGTPGGTTVADVSSLSVDAVDTSFRPLGSVAYFGALNSSSLGDGLYKTDGTVGGTTLLNAGTQDDGMLEITSAGSLAYYNYALDKYVPFTPHETVQLWRSDGTAG